jgi:membrane-associated phospholipid phosphatase
MRLETSAALGAYAIVAFVLVAALGAYVTPRTPTRIDIEAVALRGRATTLAAWFTSLGYWPALTALAIVLVVAFTRLTDPPWLPLALVASHSLSQIAIAAIKPAFHRTRPDYWLVRREVDTSFPSGHSATAMTFFLAALLLVSTVREPQTERIAGATVLACCVAGIPWSRLVLGAHYLTDVIGGILFGSGWLAASLALLWLFSPSPRS